MVLTPLIVWHDNVARYVIKPWGNRDTNNLLSGLALGQGEKREEGGEGGLLLSHPMYGSSTTGTVAEMLIVVVVYKPSLHKQD